MLSPRGCYKACLDTSFRERETERERESIPKRAEERKSIVLLEGYQSSPARPSHRSSMKMRVYEKNTLKLL